MYFVTGVKLSTDATVETHQEEGRSVASNVNVNATQITGLGTLGTSSIEQGQVLSGRHIQKELERASTADIKGERAIAVEYYCVQLQRKLELLPPTVHSSTASCLYPGSSLSGDSPIGSSIYWIAPEVPDEGGDPAPLVVYPTEGGPSRLKQGTIGSNNKDNMFMPLRTSINVSLELPPSENLELQFWDAEYEADEDDEFEVVLGNKVSENFP